MSKNISFLIILFNLFLISCSNSHEGTPVEINVDNTFGGDVITTTITPFSASFDNNWNNHITYYVANNKESLEKIINEIVKTHSLVYYYDYPDVHIGHSSYEKFYETIYGLEPDTYYYYILAFESSGTIRISPIKEFKTEEINLYITLEGSDVIWCGVNFMENRGDFIESQFIESQLFSKNSMPDANEETIPGEWRYPTKAELEQLSKICKITLIDFEKMFMRLTDNNGNNLYIPFTDQYYDPRVINMKGCAFPYSGGEGGLILNPGSHYGVRDERSDVSPIFGLYLDKIHEKPLSVTSDFYDITVTDVNGDKIQYHEKRGVRFVMDK